MHPKTAQSCFEVHLEQIFYHQQFNLKTANMGRTIVTAWYGADLHWQQLYFTLTGRLARVSLELK